MCFSSPQNDVAWRRHKEREAVAIADDGGMPPLYPQHNTGASSGGKDKGKGGGRLNQGDAGVCVRVLKRREVKTGQCRCVCVPEGGGR